LKFLGRAKRFLQDLGSEPETKTQYFNVLCASGHRVRGERTEGYQALRCPACGEGVFVLPRSPLPEPAAPPRPTSARRGMSDGWVDEGPVELTDPARVSVEIDSRESGADDAEIIWDDPPVETAPRTGGNLGTSRAQKRGPAPGEPAGGSTAKPARPTTAGTAKPVPRDNSAPVAGPPPPGVNSP
jgi:DNA-directed RNA polymerase subunit RPC12/RpoP